jgi:hypothetical protein
MAVRIERVTISINNKTPPQRVPFSEGLHLFYCVFSERGRTPRCPNGYGALRLNRMIDPGSVGENNGNATAGLGQSGL